MVTKGSNPFTEHFSAVMAEVPDPADPSTQVNMPFVRSLETADILLVAGEASTHCVPNTLLDVIANFSDPTLVKKIVLLTDAMSPVANPPGTTIFSDFFTKFMRDMTAQGVRTATTVDFLA